MRILIADADPIRTKVLSDGLVSRDLAIDFVRHGAAALEAALELTPDIVIAPVDLPVIDAPRLADILRGNPRTRHVSMIYLARDELDAPMVMDPRDAVVVEPWAIDEVRSRVHAVAQTSARYGESRSTSAVEGKLQQISLVDLLQIFQMNRRTGTLRLWLHPADATGTVHLHRGQLTDAHVPLPDGTTISGEKALYRMMTWRDGRFEFVPGGDHEHGRIEKPMRALLLEGARQLDEWERLSADFPSHDLRLTLRVPPERVPEHVHPLTREVILAVEAYREVGAIVDHCSFPDYQVLRVIADLMTRGVLAPEAGAPGSESAFETEGVFTSAQLRALRDWATTQQPRQGPVLKLVVVGAKGAGTERFLAALRDCGDFRTDARLVREPERLERPHVLGYFPLGDDRTLRLISLPADDVYEPLWEVAAHGALGTVVLAKSLDAAGIHEIEPVAQALTPLGRPMLYVVGAEALAEERGEPAPSEEERAAIARLGGGSVFVLPATASGYRKECLGVLRNLFARIVP